MEKQKRKVKIIHLWLAYKEISSLSSITWIQFAFFLISEEETNNYLLKKWNSTKKMLNKYCDNNNSEKSSNKLCINFTEFLSCFSSYMSWTVWHNYSFSQKTYDKRVRIFCFKNNLRFIFWIDISVKNLDFLDINGLTKKKIQTEESNIKE